MIKINNTTYQNPLFVFALESEAGSHFESDHKIFVGVGKVNATYYLTKSISKYNQILSLILGRLEVQFLTEEVLFVVSSLSNAIWKFLP